MAGTGAEDPAARTVELLRVWFAAFGELGRRFGTHAGLHSSDAAALVQITGAEDRGAPLTQAQLSRGIGLSTPATSALLNRLEGAGHVSRTRDRADRRVVVLRSTPAVHAEVQAFFGEVGQELDAIAASYPDDVVRSCNAMIAAMTAALERHLEDPPARDA